MTPVAELKRTLSLAQLVLYGLGTILGAGIYVLVGKVAGLAGLYAPVSFIVAAVLAGLTGLSYAELSARYPRSAGEAVYVQEGLQRRVLSVLVGFLIILTGVVSAATIANGFVGYLHVFVPVPDWLAVTLLVLLLGALAAWGISESVMAASLITLFEVGGLILVILVAGDSLGTLPARLPELIPPPDTGVWLGIMLGAFLAFYAFIGFEDMVNVAEEVKDPGRILPLAIVITIVISTVLYLLVALVAVLALPPAELAQSRAPLALIYERATGSAPTLISLISIFAVVNGALIQIIMAARVLYGMSREGWLHRALGKVHARTRTPLLATAVATAIVLALALWLPLVTLAKATSFVILIVFALVNLSLVRIKRKHPRPEGITIYPAWIPLAGFLSATGFVLFQLYQLAGN
ncbi:amino acid permease [Sulfuricaulis limicola]|uniref:Amino acid permease n=1 Tax=Sulfuricaulis limicola TaxID=1620215 RepID=A0A1B4XGY6_9GAMM|nr:APC family permease [Sulfuricaulis limicola]BAV34043.1 amino acid permease [Sulfuricaulis limicola]